NRVKAKAVADKAPLPVIYFPEGRSSKVLKALNSILGEKICTPILLGDIERVKNKIKKLELDHLDDVKIIEPSKDSNFKRYVNHLFEARKRKGITLAEAERLMYDSNYFAAMAVQVGDADAMVTGATMNYADCVRPILEIIGSGRSRVASGLNLVLI